MIKILSVWHPGLTIVGPGGFGILPLFLWLARPALATKKHHKSARRMVSHGEESVWRRSGRPPRLQSYPFIPAKGPSFHACRQQNKFSVVSIGRDASPHGTRRLFARNSRPINSIP